MIFIMVLIVYNLLFTSEYSETILYALSGFIIFIFIQKCLLVSDGRILMCYVSASFGIILFMCF